MFGNRGAEHGLDKDAGQGALVLKLWCACTSILELSQGRCPGSTPETQIHFHKPPQALIRQAVGGSAFGTHWSKRHSEEEYPPQLGDMGL